MKEAKSGISRQESAALSPLAGRNQQQQLSVIAQPSYKRNNWAALLRAIFRRSVALMGVLSNQLVAATMSS